MVTKYLKINSRSDDILERLSKGVLPLSSVTKQVAPALKRTSMTCLLLEEKDSHAIWRAVWRDYGRDSIRLGERKNMAWRPHHGH
jgi:hypothetical protein